MQAKQTLDVGRGKKKTYIAIFVIKKTFCNCAYVILVRSKGKKKLRLVMSRVITFSDARYFSGQRFHTTKGSC